jgi:bifunctional glutamyl/prolyl-tRNA synthetase
VLQPDLANTDYKKTLKMTWLIDDDKYPLVPITVIDYDHIITKAVLAKDDDWVKYLNTKSEVSFIIIIF